MSTDPITVKITPDETRREAYCEDCQPREGFPGSISLCRLHAAATEMHALLRLWRDVGEERCSCFLLPASLLPCLGCRTRDVLDAVKGQGPSMPEQQLRALEVQASRDGRAKYELVPGIRRGGLHSSTGAIRIAPTTLVVEIDDLDGGYAYLLYEPDLFYEAVETRKALTRDEALELVAIKEEGAGDD
jgi:hypothetical protein